MAVRLFGTGTVAEWQSFVTSILLQSHLHTILNGREMETKSKRIVAELSQLPQFSEIDSENGYLVHILSEVQVYPIDSVDPERGLLLLRYSGLSVEIDGEQFLGAQKLDAEAAGLDLDLPPEETSA
jgi:hypothetical protein